MKTKRDRIDVRGHSGKKPFIDTAMKFVAKVALSAGYFVLRRTVQKQCEAQ